MKCRNCGAEMSDYHVFCTNCGKPLDMGGEPAPRPAPRPAPAPAPDPVPDPMPEPEPIPDPVPAPDPVQTTVSRQKKKRREKSPTAEQKLPNKSLLIAAIALVGAAVILLAVMLITSGSRDKNRTQNEIAAQEPAAEQTAEATAAPTPTPTPTPEPTPDPEYLLPDSATQYLSNADLQGLSWEELCLARNEIFARHGRIFKTPEIAQYFSEKSWYQGTIAPERFNDGVLSAIEKANVQLIIAYENANYGGSYY